MKKAKPIKPVGMKTKALKPDTIYVFHFDEHQPPQWVHKWQKSMNKVLKGINSKAMLICGGKLKIYELENKHVPSKSNELPDF